MRAPRALLLKSFAAELLALGCYEVSWCIQLVHTRLTRGFKSFLYKGTDWHRCLGVQVSILTLSDANEALALAKIESALRLIAQYTPGHIGRIQGLVRGILVLPIYSGSLAEWNSQLDVLHRLELDSGARCIPRSGSLASRP